MKGIFRAAAGGKNPSFNQWVDALGEALPQLMELERCPQDPEWHPEGSVAVHTAMVLGVMAEQLAERQFPPERRLSALLSALLHDSGKPMVTRTAVVEGESRIISPNHTRVGVSALAYPLLTLDLPRAVIYTVLALVRHHHGPRRLLASNAPVAAYRELARQVDFELLHLLVGADLRGRAFQGPPPDDAELFRLFAEEYDLWPQREPYVAWDEMILAALRSATPLKRRLALAEARQDHEAGLIYTPEEAIARAYNIPDEPAHLVIMYGPSGSGKSYVCQELLPDYEVISLDGLRESITGARHTQTHNGQVRQAAKALLREHLRHRRRIVWDATNLRREIRSPIIQLGLEYGALVSLVVCHLSPELIAVRNRDRAHPVLETVLGRQLGTLEWPDATEAHEVIVWDGHSTYDLLGRAIPPIRG